MLTDDTLMRCPDCGEITEYREWEMRFTDCDRCGMHPMIICPRCAEWHDGVHDDVLVADVPPGGVKNPEQTQDDVK